MCEFIKKLLACLEPIIVDLDSQKEELDNVKEELDNINDFLAYVSNDVKKIGKYLNQKLIHQNLVNINSEVPEYEAMVYLIDTDNPTIQKLPQYQSSLRYMETVLQYFKTLDSKLSDMCKEISDKYHYKSLAKKYYDLFQNEDMHIDDYNEFVNFYLTLEMDNIDKQNILSYVIKKNVCYYRTNLHEEIEIDREQDLRKVQEIIYTNKGLLNDEYMSFMERVLKQVNLSLPLRQIVDIEVLEKININNLILAKTIYLTNKISQNYKSCSFGLVSKYIKEYDELMVLKEKVLNINNKDEIIKIIKGGY